MARVKKLKNRKSKRNKKVKSSESRKKSIKLLESEILESEILSQGSPRISVNIEVAESTESAEDVKEPPQATRDMLEQIMFRLPCVTAPLIGTPKQCRKDLNNLAKKMQKDPENNSIFDKIHLYMHGYLINVVLKKFPFIKGYQTVDIYQETLIALRFKAIPNFKRNKGMSFLNFAKMCIRRHLITLLNASKNRKKDQSMNQAISIDSSPLKNHDDENKTTYANLLPDKKAPVDKAIETNEAYEVTKKTLLDSLSEFERVVLKEYLSSSSYREISKDITFNLDKGYNTKSIDNALLRIRKKAIHLKRYGKIDDLPIFLPRSI